MRRANDIPASVINLRISLAQKLGANRVDILSDTGLSEEDLGSPINRISVNKAMLLWDSIQKRTGSEDIGLLSGVNIKLQSLGVLGYVMMNSKSIIEAFRKFGNHQRLVASIAFQNIHEEGSEVRLSIDLLDKWQPGFRYTLDFMVMGVFSFIKYGTGTEILPEEIGFLISEPSNIDTYRKLFGINELKFGCKTNYLLYNRTDLDAKMVGSDSEMYSHFDRLLMESLEEHDVVKYYSRAARRLIHKNMQAEIPKVDEVAAELTMSKRALQGKLKEEGTSYQQLVNDIRKEISIRELKNKNLNITEVAFLTGHTDISVFSRNFKKWTGLSPLQFQSQFD